MRFLARNVVLTYAVYAASILSGLVLTPIILREIGATAYGLWAFAGALAAFLGLLDLGVAPSIVRFAAEQRGRGAEEETSELASTGLAVYLAVALLTSAVGAVLVVLFPRLIDIPQESLLWPARIAAALAIAGFVVRFPIGLFHNLLMAHQRFDVVNVASLLSTALYAALVLAVLTQLQGLVTLALIALAATLARLVLPLAWVRRELPGLRLRRRLVSPARVRQLATFSSHNFLLHVSGKVVFTADVIVVGVLLGPRAAAIYAIPAKLFALAYGIGIAGTNLLFPVYAELEGAEQPVRQRRYLLAGIRGGMAVVLLVGVPLIVLPEPFLRAWLGAQFGEGFGDGVAVLALLAAALCFSQPLQVISQYLVARGRHQRFAYVRAAAVVVNLALSVVLVKSVGIWGIAAATLLTEGLLALTLAPALVRALGDVALSELARAWGTPLAVAAVATPVLVAAYGVGVDTWLGLLPFGAAWTAVFGLLVWRFALAESERAHYRRALFRLRVSTPA